MTSKQFVQESRTVNYADNIPKTKVIHLDLTSNSLGFPKAVSRRFKLELLEGMEKYPLTPELSELKLAIATKSRLHESQILLTSGADQGIEISLTHLLKPGNRIGILVPTFPRFQIVAETLCGAKVQHFLSLTNIPTECKVVALCTPNNPTTEELNQEELRAIIMANSSIWFLIDAVFADFGSWDPASFIKNLPNVIVLKSLSKSFGLSGLRVGWIESQKQNIQELRKGISPFRVPLICQKLALGALTDHKHILNSIKFFSEEFDWIQKKLTDNVFRKSNVPFFYLKQILQKKQSKCCLKKGSV